MNKFHITLLLAFSAFTLPKAQEISISDTLSKVDSLEIRPEIGEKPLVAPTDIVELDGEKPLRNQIGLTHLQSFYSEGLQTMSNTSIQYLYRTKEDKMTFIGRVTLRQRNGDTSFKYDVESYLKHGKKHYSFLGLSTSDKKMFPNFEAFYSLYSALPKGYELETGVKYLDAENFSLFTPVIGIAKDINYSRLILRNFFTFAESKMYFASAFTFKQTLNEKKDNFQLLTGYGKGVDSRNMDFSENFVVNKSFYFGASLEKNFHPIKLSLATVYNRNHYSTGREFNQYDIYLNAFYNF